MEKVGCTKASAKESDRCTVRFKVCGMSATWSDEGWEKNDWTRSVMSQNSFSAVECGSDVKLRISRQHLGADGCET